MTDHQLGKLHLLKTCTMLPGAHDKRFVGDLLGYPPDAELSRAQAAYLETLWHRYRVQLSHRFAMHPRTFGDLRPDPS